MICKKCRRQQVFRRIRLVYVYVQTLAFYCSISFEYQVTLLVTIDFEQMHTNTTNTQKSNLHIELIPETFQRKKNVRIDFEIDFNGYLNPSRI